MKKALTPILAVVAVIAIIFCFVVNGQKGDAQNKLNDANAQLETLKSEGEAKLAEATAAKDEIQAKLDEATAAKDEIQAKLDEATAQIDTLKADAEAAAAQKTELEEKVNALTKQIEEVAAAAKEGAAAVVENATEAVTDAVEGAKDAAAEAVETATEAVTEAVEGAKDAAVETVEAVTEAAPMTHAEYIAAENDSEVVIESYVQDHQSWWDNKVTVYLQSEDGAYFAYEMACSEEDAAKLVPGTKIRVKGYKGEWAGEVEIMDGTFEFIEADPWIAEAADVTALLASEDLANHMNEFVAVKGATVVAQEDGAAFAYKNAEEKTDDLYFAVDVDGQTYNFCVEFYLRGKDSEVYKAVEGLKVGDVVDLEGFLYWYNGANLQATSLIVK
ncbi:MAG: hypothetical protein IJ231_08055 [Clostridia bacterium]|nr:hypothetical protein [Clostridia bacterium]